MNKEDKIKLIYDHSKTYMFGIFSVVLIISFGVLVNIDRFTENRLALYILIFIVVALLIGFFASKHMFEKAYNKLLGITKPYDLLR